MSWWKRVLGLDQVTAHGSLEVQVRYLDGGGRDGAASGIGFVNVSPRGLVWKIDGYNLGNRDWAEITSWTERAVDDAQARLDIIFEGVLRVRQVTSNMRITVRLTSSPRSIRRLTSRAQQFAELGVIGASGASG